MLLWPSFEVIKGSEDCMGVKSLSPRSEVSGFLGPVYRFILKEHNYFLALGSTLTYSKAGFFEWGNVVDCVFEILHKMFTFFSLCSQLLI